ncbi:MAG: hypothetical protein ACKO2P_16940 [Planctomycetota bacterium]
MGAGVSVGLSLLGDGRVLQLTRRNVRTAISQLKSTSTSSMRQIRDLVSGVDSSPGAAVPVVDRLLTERRGTLTRCELRGLERVLNRGLISGVLRLPPFQPEFLEGAICSGSGGQKQRRGFGLLYNGVLFEVRQISRGEMVSGGPRDVLLEDRSGGLHFLRFLAVKMTRDFLAIQSSSRYDLHSSKLQNLRLLDPLAIYSVLRAQPVPGFHFTGCAPFLGGG